MQDQSDDGDDNDDKSKFSDTSIEAGKLSFVSVHAWPGVRAVKMNWLF